MHICDDLGKKDQVHEYVVKLRKAERAQEPQQGHGGGGGQEGPDTMMRGGPGPSVPAGSGATQYHAQQGGGQGGAHFDDENAPHNREQQQQSYTPGESAYENSQVHAAAAGGKAGPSKVVSAAGVPSPSSNDMSHIGRAVNLARSADTVVLAVGTDITMASEPKDASNISFTAAQSALIEQVAAAAKKPVVVLLLSATPLDLSTVLANPKVGAVLTLGVPSVTVMGIEAILYGDSSPAGRTGEASPAHLPPNYLFHVICQLVI